MLTVILSPLSLIFWLITIIRRNLFQSGFLKSYKASVPVIIVGNLSVGGNGKTPVVVWLVEQLQAKGLKVGVISRGYGSQSKHFPLLVTADTEAKLGGDEPVLIAKRTGVPICISPNRQESIELLLSQFHCDVIIADDGLQHYKLQRDIEIVVMGEKGLGNGFLLPAGPLRELPSRLQSVDLIITNGLENAYSQAIMQLIPEYAINLKTGEKCKLAEFNTALSEGVSSKSINALAGIGNPQRFFTMLENLGFSVDRAVAFQDHQAFTEEMFAEFEDQTPLFMTEKDAVKCKSFAKSNWWFVPVTANITDSLNYQGKLASFLQKIIHKVEANRKN